MQLPYQVNEKYSTKVGYFSMEFAIHQALKIYSGGLGFLAGSHMRSVYDLSQNVVGVGMLWSFGYYDQERTEDRSMNVMFRRKLYSFLEDTGIVVTVKVNGHPVKVKALYLKPEVFNSAPLYLLTTDIDENDFLTRTITHKLYDAHTDTRLAQEIVLGIGGAKVLEAAGENVAIHHMNEGHALPMAFYLYNKYKDVAEVKKRVCFTTHTPEKAGNEEHNINHMAKMGFFDSLDLDTVRGITGIQGDMFSLTIGAIKLSKRVNAVSKIHADVSNEMWKDVLAKDEKIIPITNAQNKNYWLDKGIQRAFEENEDYQILARKKHNKRVLFDIVADQTGKLFDPDVLTIVWARRFAEYKRANLLMRDFDRLKNLIEREDRPIQVIWAGKPHPADSNAINLFNELIYKVKGLKRCAVLVGYELGLSMALKKGADIWLNNPRYTREASGTSGMTASMNGALHLSIDDGWHPEFANHGKNSFTIPATDHTLDVEVQDEIDYNNMMTMIEEEVIPTYYDEQKQWIKMMKSAIKDSIHDFNSGRMADEYYMKMYNYEPEAVVETPKKKESKK